MAHLERQRALSPAVGWWALQLCLTVVACAQMWLSQLSIDSCTETSCDYTAFAATLNAFFIGALFLLLASAAGIVLLRRSGRQPALAPILGILLLIAWLAVAYASSRAALQLPLFGNRLSHGTAVFFGSVSPDVPGMHPPVEDERNHDQHDGCALDGKLPRQAEEQQRASDAPKRPADVGFRLMFRERLKRRSGWRTAEVHDEAGGSMRSINPIPGNPWPHDMVITVEDRPSTLLELLWVREAHDLHFDVTDLPPILIDTPAAPRGRTLAPAERAAWEQAWPRVWRAASQHAGRDDASQQFERLERTAVGSPERQKILEDLVGPDWRGEFGDAVFDDDSYQEWSQRGTDAQLSSMRQRMAESPEHRDLDALIPAWRAGLTKIVTVPCRGEYSRKISGNALLMTDATRAASTSYRRALAAFGQPDLERAGVRGRRARGGPRN